MGAFNPEKFSLDNMSFSANPKTKLQQSWHIACQLDRLQRLYAYGFTNFVPDTIKSLYLTTKNLHDKRFRLRLDLISQEVTKKADRLFPLKYHDVKTRSSKFIAKSRYIQREYYERMLEELMQMFQRIGVLPGRAFADVEAGIAIRSDDVEGNRGFDVG